MNAEERHELRENDLAGWLKYGMWNFFKQYGSYLLLAASLTFLGIMLYRRHLQNVEFENASAWAQLDNLPHAPQAFEEWIRAEAARGQAEAELTTALKTHDKEDDHKKAVDRAAASAQEARTNALDLPKNLQELIDKHDIKPLQARAYLRLGEYYQSVIMMPELLKDPDLKLSREESLKRAADAYRKAAEVMPDAQPIVFQSQLGLAGTFEDLGDWDKARDAYKEVGKGAKFDYAPFADFGGERSSDDSIAERRRAPRLVDRIPELFEQSVTSMPSPSPSLSPGGILDLPGALKGLGGTLTPPPPSGTTAPSSGGTPPSSLQLGPTFPSGPLLPPPATAKP